MLDVIARLLVALALGAQGVGTAADHASPDGNAKAIAAIEAIIAQVSAAVEQAQAAAGEQPDTTGLDRATEVANEHAADGLEKAAEAQAAGQANADAAAPADAPEVDAPPVDTPPVDTPAASGPPATHPPVLVPPVPTPPVDAPGQGNRP
ncbi:MAG TPA: hypothetical protein VGQ64_12565 [Candidatus Limnocylindrales bacterium]|jgi:hypothetical protein|nr:hypothetical protein [Candidatus Limnocylindrales bacterium]